MKKKDTIKESRVEEVSKAIENELEIFHSGFEGVSLDMVEAVFLRIPRLLSSWQNSMVTNLRLLKPVSMLIQSRRSDFLKKPKIE